MATGARLSIAVRRKAFGGVPVLGPIALEVAASETVCLLGPSGVGKSTLLRLVAGIDRDFEGQIAVDGLAPARAPVPGFVFQDPRLLPWATALGNLLAVAPEAGEARARALLAAVGLAGSEGALPRMLSGGMQRRVALARALAVAPRLLLLDEPFVSLDRALVRELHALVLRLAAGAGPTVLLVSHSAEDAARLAHRVVVLGGRPARVLREERLPGEPARRGEAEVAAIAATLGAG